MKWLPSLRRDTAEGSSTDERPAETIAVASIGAAPEAPSVPEAGERTALVDAPLTDSAPVATGAGPLVARPSSPSGPEAGDAGVDPTLDALRELVAESIQGATQPIGEAQRALQELFTSRIRSDEVQAKALETLHDELRQYKTNFVRQQLLPVLKEVIFCHDFVAGQMERLAADPAATGEAARQSLSVTRQMLLDLLFKYDVEPYLGESEQFDPKTQQCAKTVPTGRAEADKTIAGRNLTGFRSPEAIIRREQVTVYKFTPGAE